MDLIRKIFGTKNDRDIKALRPWVQKINQWEEKIKLLSDEQLQQQTVKFRQNLAAGQTLEDLLPEAFATVREASVRTLGMRHFDVQLMGGVVLFQNKISEMKTGEGKTLTATLPLYLHALAQKGAHLVTVNDYLAKRDSEWMGTIYKFLGLSIGCIVNNLSDEERKVAYNADITYGTNNEFAFDYLRDNMKFDLGQYVQRGHYYCIVDEVDSILIDEARTPLLISGSPNDGNLSGLYVLTNRIVQQLTATTHFTVDEKSKSAVLTDDGVTKVQELLKINDLFALQNAELLHHLHQALKANYLFKIDVDYVVKNEKVIIVDEFTGRLKEGSRWSDGLHQAVEAKENIQIRQENQTLASITFQNYFRLYHGLAGMTGTADTEAEEFRKIYKLDVVVIPTNELMIRQDDADVIYKNREAKYQAVINLIQELYQRKQPVLVGTISIDSSEEISRRLKKCLIPHQVLNAKQHEKEAQIISLAGQKGAVTIATNMAGRGTDIKLNDETKELGGLFILGTERHESRRIDNQLRGRSGRQGDPGHSKFFLSLEDDLMRIFGSDRIKGIMSTLGMKDDEPIEHKMISNAIAKAQKKVESHNFEIRKHLLEYDNVMNDQRKVIYKIRREILSDNGNMEFILEMLEDIVTLFVERYRPEKKLPLDQWPWAEMLSGFQNTFRMKQTIRHEDCIRLADGDLNKYLYTCVKEHLTEKFAQYRPEQVKLAIREILLSTFDSLWQDHLAAMDHLKEGINLKAYAQKDPLNEYKREAFNLFEEMRIKVKQSVIDTVLNVKLYTEEEIEELKRKQQQILEAQLAAHKRQQQAVEDGKKRPILREKEKVGRNDLCPCGSGKKFKHCHGT